VRLKILPSSRLSPWVAAGGGYALYEQSAKLSNGQSTTNKFLSRGVFDFGGGLDYRLYRFIGLRSQPSGSIGPTLSGNTRELMVFGFLAATRRPLK